MPLANFLSVDDLITELKMGKATVKFILDRFSPWLDAQLSEKNHQYSPLVIPLLIRIADLLSSGMLPSQIEELIENDLQGSAPAPRDAGTDIRMNPGALEFIRDMVGDIRGHQGRIARAHEKRAEAEERKAAAIEKRAEAEEKKAQAMNNIAMALQEMGRLRTVDSQTMEIAGQAAQAMAIDEGMDPEYDADDWDEDFEDPLAGMEELLNHPEPEPLDKVDVDDLSLLVDEPGLSQGDLDDLSSLIDTVSGTEDMDTLLGESRPLPQLDDLSMLVDEASKQENESKDMDDLYGLLDTTDTSAEDNLDDLSVLVDQDLPPIPRDMDDLSRLIDPVPRDTAGETSLDNLNLLVDIPSQNAANQDDLWSLIDKDGVDKGERNIPVDDLSALVDPPRDNPSLKPDITPEQDLPRYKAAVMKIIIELKSRGLSAQETTDRLNMDEVATLSGKPRWAKNAIVKIYGFIDSAK